MCGIVGVISPEFPILGDILSTMRDRLSHRGPDHGANWLRLGGKIALAHRRLSIIDTTHAADQPMHRGDGLLCIVFNGEIYNYVELRAELTQLGHTFRTQSDTEVLLAALQEWGESALLRLNGMFAFVLWDERSHRLLVARDRFGEKPLFVGRGQFNTVVFASEMKAILAHPAMPCSVNARAVERFSAGSWYEDDELTFFEGIERFPPAHAAWFREDGSEERRWRYWTPDYNNIDTSLSPAVAIDKFTELLQRSIKLRLRADVPVGSSLSGGLDSSTIVGMISGERANTSFTQNTFSACFDDDPVISEGPQIDEVVKYTSVQSHKVKPTAHGLMAESSRLHWHQEEPFLSASIYLQWCVARLAKEQDTTVLLDGQGADELLAGYQFYFKQFQLDMLDKGSLFSAAIETMKFNARLQRAAKCFADNRRRFNEKVAYSNLELLAVILRRPSVWHGDYSCGLVSATPGNRLRRTIGEALQYNCLPMLLRYADRNSMAFSRETRLPFLDYDLVDFCISLPDTMLIRDGWQKWVLRKASNKYIPKSIQWRADKVGYAAPLDIWLRGPMKGWAYERIFSDRFTHLEHYSRSNLEKLWQNHQNNLENNSWALWRWISLSEWFELINRGWWK